MPLASVSALPDQSRQRQREENLPKHAVPAAARNLAVALYIWMACHRSSLPCTHPVRGGVGTSPNRWDVTVPIPAARGRSLVGTVQICTAPAEHTWATDLLHSDM